MGVHLSRRKGPADLLLFLSYGLLKTSSYFRPPQTKRRSTAPDIRLETSHVRDIRVSIRSLHITNQHQTKNPQGVQIDAFTPYRPNARRGRSNGREYISSRTHLGKDRSSGQESSSDKERRGRLPSCVRAFQAFASQLGAAVVSALFGTHKHWLELTRYGEGLGYDLAAGCSRGLMTINERRSGEKQDSAQETRQVAP